MAMQSTTIKRGDTVFIVGTYEENGEAVDLTGYAIASQARYSIGALIETLVATLADDQDGAGKGQFTLAPIQNPPDWPIDALVCDVQFTQGGNVRSFPTFRIIVEQDVTR
jgi:hypothetical protein